MDVYQKRGDSFIIRPSFRGTKKGHHHLGMPITNGTDAKNLSESIIVIITKVNLEKQIVGFIYDSGDNLNNCLDNIYSELDHTAVFTSNKLLFLM